jgi:phosphatidylglycerol:prolipoprotein diacylglycerol transferase
MNPVCFHIGPKPIYWYGVMVALAFLATVTHWNALARRDHRPVGFGSEIAFWIMLSGILGARIAYILANLDYYLASPAEIIRLDRGGLIYYGGFIGATLALIVFARRHKEPVLSLADFCVTGLPLGHAIGRIGCFLNGCCYGLPTTSFLGIHYPANSDACLRYGDVAVLPVQLFESAINLVLYAVLLYAYPRRKKHGSVLALYLLTYPIARFLLEFLRGDERLHWIGLNAAQVVSVVLFASGVGLWAVLRKKTE